MTPETKEKIGELLRRHNHPMEHEELSDDEVLAELETLLEGEKMSIEQIEDIIYENMGEQLYAQDISVKTIAKVLHNKL